MAQMKIILNATDGSAVSVDVHPTETYRMLKERIQNESGINLDTSQIFFEGKPVEEEQNIYESFFGASAKLPELPNIECVVDGCSHSKLTHPNKEIFRFPLENERCSNWLSACNRQDLLGSSPSTLNIQYGVCSDHFHETCFLDGSTRRHLRKGSVPVVEVQTTALFIHDLGSSSDLLLASPAISSDNEGVTFIVDKDETELKPLPSQIESTVDDSSEKRTLNESEMEEVGILVDDLEDFDDEVSDPEESASQDLHPGLVCRLCALPVEEAHFIFSESGKENKLLEKINTSIPVSIHCNDLLPKQLCAQCLSSLDTCYSFAMACVKAEKTLKKMVRRQRFRCQKESARFISEGKGNQVDVKDDIGIGSVNSAVEADCYDCPLCCQGSMAVQKHVDIDELEGRKPKDEPDYIEVQEFLASENMIWDGGEGDCNSDDLYPDNQEGDEEEEEGDYNEEEDASCMICRDNFVSMNQLLEHAFSHSDGIIFPCSCCGLSFTSRNDLVMHLELHQEDTVTRPFKCGDCDKLFVSEARAEFHQEYVHTGGGDSLSLSCLECGKSFKREGNLWDHVRIVHRGEKPFSCPTCGKTFIVKARLKTHLRIHAGEAPYECGVCSETFPDHSSLKAHDATHVDMKMFQCDQCGRCFARKYLFAAHVRQHLEKKPRAYTCRICGEDGFDTLPKLLVHRRSMHQDMILPLGTKKDKIYKCQQCEKAFAGRGALKHHMMSHTGELPHVCEFCNKGFTQKRSLILHRRTHTGEKPYQCGDCGKRFVQSAHLYSHLRLHTGEKPYQCSECDATFRLKDVRDSHQRKHTGERPFKCKVCGKAFRTSHSYYQHTWIHTGRKPYPCTYCGKAFRRSNGLKVHIRIHTGEKPHECDVCGRGFAQKQDMKKHRNLHAAGKL